MPEYLHPAPRMVYQKMIDNERAMIAAGLRTEMSEEAARVSVMLDLDRGELRSQLAYCELWNWSRGKVRHQWKTICGDVDNWRSFFRKPTTSEQPASSQRTTSEQPEKARNQADIGTSQPANNQRTTSQQPANNQRTYSSTDTDTDSEIKKGESPARAKRAAFTPPSFEDVDKYFKALGMPKGATTFYDHYQSNGWRVGRNPMKDWQATARNWKRREEKQRPPKETQQQYEYDGIFE